MNTYSQWSTWHGYPQKVNKATCKKLGQRNRAPKFAGDGESGEGVRGVQEG